MVGHAQALRRGCRPLDQVQPCLHCVRRKTGSRPRRGNLLLPRSHRAGQGEAKLLEGRRGQAHGGPGSPVLSEYISILTAPVELGACSGQTGRRCPRGDIFSAAHMLANFCGEEHESQQRLAVAEDDVGNRNRGGT
jgi:hypothetical protein